METMNILAVALFFSIDSLISFDLYLHSFFVPRQRSLRLTCTLCVYEPRFNLRPFQETTLLVWSLNYLSRIRNTLYFIRNSLIFLYPIPWIFLKQIHSTNSWNIFDNILKNISFNTNLYQNSQLHNTKICIFQELYSIINFSYKKIFSRYHTRSLLYHSCNKSNKWHARTSFSYHCFFS